MARLTAPHLLLALLACASCLGALGATSERAPHVPTCCWHQTGRAPAGNCGRGSRPLAAPALHWARCTAACACLPPLLPHRREADPPARPPARPSLAGVATSRSTARLSLANLAAIAEAANATSYAVAEFVDAVCSGEAGPEEAAASSAQAVAEVGGVGVWGWGQGRWAQLASGCRFIVIELPACRGAAAPEGRPAHTCCFPQAPSR